MQISESAVARGVNADKQRSFKDRYVTDPTMFRVMSVMTTSIRLQFSCPFHGQHDHYKYLKVISQVFFQCFTKSYTKSLLDTVCDCV